MALSKGNKRNLKHLRRDAERLWSEQREVFGKARNLAGDSVAGAVRELVEVSPKLQQLQSEAAQLRGCARRRAARLAQKLETQQHKLAKKGSGPGVGGWFLIGAGVAAVAAVGYALWQTFRADDDLWIADEELDAPVKSVTNGQ